ncbi:alpha-1,4-digalacturonate transport system substrate-binding protein [Bosea sp. BE125]|uniref:ABC transporter substrate-binding protein n=1 Tax=Bosea sp. BE125 TaxID=2817909 RepID=UPI002860E454|nr:ABC transporter substrate-binding protein [Bosea sp. BE125]MDR6871625.1 alpha-1,4-digalacturonate transport system substrate-binding protein [Bosea sp. BE125]
MTMRAWVSALAVVTGLLVVDVAQAQTTVRMSWYSDGNEGEVVADLLKRFEAQNKDIKIVLDQVPYKAINENLPVQLASGQGPDIARVVDLGGIARYALDLRPYLKDAAYWDTNFGPFLEWMRPQGDTNSIPGFMTQLTVTGPFVNKTLFEQAGIAMPGAKATWEDWAKATKDVAAKVQAPFPIAMDRSGHRFFGLAISEGAKLFDAKGEPAVIDDGLKRAAQLVYDWHKSGVMAKELWGSVSGAAYRGANDEFKNAQVVMYMSGSWQIAQFDKTVGNAFDWVAVPTPCGPAGCTAMPGGAGLVAIKTTKNPAAVARVMEYLASEPVLSEFYSRSLFVPGHIGIAAKGLDYKDASPLAKASLKVFSDQVAGLSPVAYKLQGYANNRIIFNAVISRVGQAISGETTLDEAYKRIASDVEQQIAERNKK